MHLEVLWQGQVSQAGTEIDLPTFYTSCVRSIFQELTSLLDLPKTCLDPAFCFLCLSRLLEGDFLRTALKYFLTCFILRLVCHCQSRSSAVLYGLLIILIWSCHIAYWTICMGNSHCHLNQNTGKSHVLCAFWEKNCRKGAGSKLPHPTPFVEGEWMANTVWNFSLGIP